MILESKRIVFQPGVVAAPAAITLPTSVGRIGAVLFAQILRTTHDHVAVQIDATAAATTVTHDHTAIQVDATAVAGDIAAFVGLIDGAGAAVAGVTIGHAGGAGADIAVPTSADTDGNTFVPLLDGAGNAVAGTMVRHAGGAGADVSVPTSEATDTVSVVPAVATRASATTITLDVNTLAADLLVLDIVAEGAFPVAA